MHSADFLIFRRMSVNRQFLVSLTEGFWFLVTDILVNDTS